jgi:thiosulfate dehydrogenase [quinone] large subunit
VRLRDAQLAYVLLRVYVGVNLAMHGVTRFLSGTHAFVDGMVRSFAQTPLPAAVVHAFGVVLTPLELLLGVLVLLGAWLRPALIGATLLMTVLTFGTTLRQDWPTVGIQLVYALAYFVLLVRRSDDALSVDSLRGSRAPA